ncbi:unnamed protein product, partial [Closterium sp. NIES-64]
MPFTVFARNKRQSGKPHREAFLPEESPWPAVSPASLFLRLAQSRFLSAGLRPLRVDLDASTSIRCWLPASAAAAAAAATAAAASRRRAQQQARWERNPPLLLLHGFGGPGHQQGEQGGRGGDDARNHDNSGESKCGSAGDAATVHWHQLVGSLSRDFELYVPNLVWFGESAPSSPRLPETVAELRQAQHAAFEGTFWAPAFLYRDLLKVLFSGSRTQQQHCLDEYIRDRPLNPWLNPVLKQEVLIVCGRKDPIAPLPFGKMLLQHLGVSSRLVLVNDARHMPHAQCPKEFASLVRYFLHAPHG